MSNVLDLPPAARALLVEYHANWLPVAQVQAAGSEAADAGFTGFIHFPDPPPTPEQVADFRARWRACFAAAEEAAEPVTPPAPKPAAPPQPAPATAPSAPFHAGSEWPMARQEVSLVLAEARRLERYVGNLDAPLLLGYAGVAVATLEHLERALDGRQEDAHGP